MGIAIGAGAEIAMEAADMVLVRSQLSDVVIALHLSTAIFHRISNKNLSTKVFVRFFC